MKQNIFLFMLLGAIVVPAFCIYIYPWPNMVKDQETNIIKLHDDSVALIQDAIKKAIQQQEGIRVIGSSFINKQEQAEKDEILWKEKLVQENKEYHERLQKIHQYPLASGELIGLLGVYVALLGLHLHQIRL